MALTKTLFITVPTNPSNKDFSHVLRAAIVTIKKLRSKLINTMNFECRNEEFFRES